MRKLLVLFIIPVFANAQVNQKEFRVILKLDSFKVGEKFYLEYANTSNKDNPYIIDSLETRDDKIIFKGKIGEPATANIYRYKLEKIDTAYYTKLLESLPLPEDEKEETLHYFLNPLQKQSFEFFLVEGETTIKAKDNLFNAKAEGPKPVTDFVKLKKDARDYVTKKSNPMDEFLGVLAFAKKDTSYQEKMMKRADSINKRMKDDVYLGYVRENPSSPLALYALTNGMPNQIDSARKYMTLFSSLSPEIRQGPSAIRLLQTLEAALNTEVGRVISDFQQTDSLGNIVKFSSFKGKYVLIELWASWCGPCRRKNPGLVKIYEKYNKKNFTVLGVALEEKNARDKWLAAIRKDKLTWPQLTDFKSWDNAVAKQFGVRAIPFNLLVDPNGKILGKNLYDQELDDFLAALLKN